MFSYLTLLGILKCFVENSGNVVGVDFKIRFVVKLVEFDSGTGYPVRCIGLRRNYREGVTCRYNRVEALPIDEVNDEITSRYEPSHAVSEEEPFILYIVKREVKTSNVGE